MPERAAMMSVEDESRDDGPRWGAIYWGGKLVAAVK